MEQGRGLPRGTLVAGDWRIEGLLGQGGFGVTYEARNRATGVHAALKEYMPSGLCTRIAGSTKVVPAQGPAGDIFKRGMASFMREAETLARLDHPSIVRVKGFFEANGTAYMALDFEAGGTLAAWLANLGRRPTQDELDQLAWPLFEALIQVHSLPLLHRDIKPDNILLRADGTPVLIDFGAVKSLVASGTRSLGAPGTLNFVTDGYAPPEQYVPDGEGLLGPWTDVYALGATFYECVTGTKPPSAPYRQVEEAYQPLAEEPGAGGGWRPAFLAGIDQALALRRSERPQSMVELRRALGLAAMPVERPGGPRLGARLGPGQAAGRGPDPSDRPPRGAASRRRDDGEAHVPVVTFGQLPASQPVAPAPSRAGRKVAALLAVLALAGGGWLAAQGLPPWLDPTVRKAEAERRIAEAKAARLEAEAKAKRLAKEKEDADAAAKAKADAEAEAQRAAKAKAEAEAAERVRIAAEAAAKAAAEAAAEARRRDPVAALVPGSGQAARDRLADGRDCPFCPEMVVVPAGTFRMGSPDGSGGLNGTKAEEGRDGDEGPVREVTIRQAFAVGRTHVTRGEFAVFMRESGHQIPKGCVTGTGSTWEQQADASWQAPGFAQDDSHPVVCINWDDANAYAKWLSGRTVKTYRLLKEAEMEYAIRGVTRASDPHPRYWFGNEAKDLCAHANGADQTFNAADPNVAPCRDGFTHTAPIANFKPNAFGLYHATGNAWSWTEDCWIDNYRNAPSDERARTAACTEGSRRVVRGGSWSYYPQVLRSAYRVRSTTDDRVNDLSLRVGRTF